MDTVESAKLNRGGLWSQSLLRLVIRMPYGLLEERKENRSYS